MTRTRPPAVGRSEEKSQKGVLPFPPMEMRVLVGPTEDGLFDNPNGSLVFSGLEPAQFRSVLDFGCGCGRIARQMIQQRPRPQRYAGIDLHAGMVNWCNRNLAPHAPGFTFHHHDVFYGGFNPGDDKPLYAPFPFADNEFSLIVATSVFTHLTQTQSEAYFAEISRVLEPRGVLVATWFLFDKRDFPMMQDEQNTLFINEYDIRNAVIYDRAWVRDAAANVELVVHQAIPPGIRGHQWDLRMTQPRPDVREIDLPEDRAQHGRKPPPPMPSDAYLIGRDGAKIE